MKKTIFCAAFLLASQISYAAISVCDDQKTRCVSIEDSFCGKFGCPYMASYSTDGMKTWQSGNVKGASPYGYRIGGIACGTQLEHCIATTTDAMSSKGMFSTARVLVSSNGGVYWSIVEIPFANGGCGVMYPPGRGLGPIKCNETGLNCEAYGYCFDSSRASIYNYTSTTKDGGLSWESKLGDRIIPSKYANH